MSSSQAITLTHLSKQFGPLRAVDDVSFSVGKGEIFGFMGHNGAGKTTTIRMLLGLLRPSGGSANVLGHDIVTQSLAVRQRCGFLPGSYALPRELTVEGFLRYIGARFGLSGSSLERRIDALLEQFDLTAVRNKRLGQFSTGMSQKVGLAQALINDPEVLLLDEPTAGLDPLGRHDFLQFIRGLARDSGVTVLFSTHILSDIERVCERVAILHRGKLVAVGPLAELKASHAVNDMDDLYLKLARAAA